MTLVVFPLFQNHPEFIRAPTIDGVLPLHAACSHGHADIVDLILSFPYPDAMHKMYREQSGARMYRLGLEINAMDGHGRTALHLAAMNGHVVIVARLLSFTVSILYEFTGSEVRKVSASDSPKRTHKGRNPPSPVRPDSPKTTSVDCDHQEAVEQFHPVEVDRLDLDGNSSLHLTVKRSDRTLTSYHQIALLLLQHGANPSKPLINVGGNSSALSQACDNDDIEMMDLLLGNGATDDDHAVLCSAVERQNDEMIATVLKYRSHVDTEYQVNHGTVTTDRHDFGRRPKVWPNVGVALNWHGLGLPLVNHIWLHNVCLLHNSVGSGIGDHQVALAAITRIDVSRNNLSLLPEELFQLPSLRVLSAANNRIRWIPGCEVRIGEEASITHVAQTANESGIFQCNIDHTTDGSNSSSKLSSVAVATGTWNAPLLEEVDLQANQLKDLPGDLFKLPLLRKLNVSHNDIESVPYDMWKSECLIECNLCDNSLTSLPSFRGKRPDTSASSIDSSSYPTSPIMSDRHGDEHRLTLDFTDASDEAYDDHHIQSVSHWQQSLSITMTTACDSVGDANTRMSRLSELNLSKNALTSVPEGLSCLAPRLSKLDLSHNKIKRVCSIQNLPASVKWIDLSHNNIERCMLAGVGGEANRSVDGSYVERCTASRICYSAFYQTRPSNRYDLLSILCYNQMLMFIVEPSV